MTQRRLPAPWAVTEEAESFKVSTADGLSLVWVTYRAKEVIGTNPDRLTREEARKLASRISKIPDEPRFNADEKAALLRFMASRPDLKTEGEAVRYLVADALTGLGELALPKENRGPGARKG